MLRTGSPAIVLGFTSRGLGAWRTDTRANGTAHPSLGPRTSTGVKLARLGYKFRRLDPSFSRIVLPRSRTYGLHKTSNDRNLRDDDDGDLTGASRLASSRSWRSIRASASTLGLENNNKKHENENIAHRYVVLLPGRPAAAAWRHGRHQQPSGCFANMPLRHAGPHACFCVSLCRPAVIRQAKGSGQLADYGRL